MQSNAANLLVPPPSRFTAGARWAILVLSFCCVCWGMSFPVMQFALSSLDRATGSASLAGKASFNGWRYAAAALLYGLLTFRRQGGYSAADWLAGATVGLFLGGGMFLQIAGLRYTLPSVSAFLTALAVVFAPLAQASLFRRRVGWRTWLGVVIAIIGIVLLSLPNPNAAGSRMLACCPPIAHLGEILTILSSVFFTAQILALDRLGPKADPVRLTFVMLITTALVNGLGGIALGAGPIYRPAVLLPLLGDKVFMASLLSLVVLGSVLAMHLMNRYQPRVSPATATVVYCLEPVFATLFSVMLGTESLTLLTAGGGAAVLLAVLIVAA